MEMNQQKSYIKITSKLFKAGKNQVFIHNDAVKERINLTEYYEENKKKTIPVAQKEATKIS